MSVGWIILPTLILGWWNNRSFWRFLLSHPERFGWDTLRHFLQGPVLDILWLGILFFATIFFGRILLKCLGCDPMDPWQNLIFSFGLGAGAIGHGVLLLGLLGALKHAFVWRMVLCLAAVAGCLSWRSFWKPLQIPKTIPWWQAIALGLLVWSLWHGFIMSFAPSSDWDTLAYNLAVPKLYLQQGSIFFIPWIMHANWPLEMGMWTTLSLLVGSDSLAQLWLWLQLCLLIVATACFARHYFSSSIAVVTCALLTTLPLVERLVGTARVEVLWALFAFNALWAMTLWTENKNTRWLVFASVMGGLCASTKLLGLGSLLALGVIAVVSSYRHHQESLGRSFLRALMVLTVGSLVASPWYVRNILWTGNPVWPFAGSLFGYHQWDASLSQRFPEWMSFLSKGYSLENFVLLPLRLVASWQEFSYDPRYFPHYFMVPFAILLAASFFFKKKVIPHPLGPFLIFALISCFVIFHQTSFWRYFFPALPGMALWLSWMAGNLWAEGGWRARLPCLFLILALVPSLGLTQNNELFFFSHMRSSLPSLSPREAYLVKSLQIYPMQRYINTALSRDSKVLLFQEVRGYHLDVPYVWGDPLNQWVIRYDQGWESLDQDLKREHITHVLVNHRTIYSTLDWYYTPRILETMAELLRRKARLIRAMDGIELYELDRR